MGRPIIMDMDGVMCDFIQGFTELGAKQFGITPYSTLEQKVWDEIVGLNDEQIDHLWQIVKGDRYFWLELKPLATPQEILDLANLRHRDCDLYFTTARVGYQAKQQTEEWLWAWGVTDPTVLISSRKGEVASALKAHYAIDDKAGNAVAIRYLSPQTHSYIMDRPYNAGLNPKVIGSKVRRVGSLAQFVEDVKHGK